MNPERFPVRDEVQRCAASFESAKCSVAVHADEPVHGRWDPTCSVNLVRTLGGTVRAESKPHVETRFTVELPIGRPES